MKHEPVSPAAEILAGLEDSEVACDQLSAIDYGGIPPVHTDGASPAPFDQDEEW